MANRIGFTDTLTGKETVCGTWAKRLSQLFSFPFHITTGRDFFHSVMAGILTTRRKMNVRLSTGQE